MTATALVGANVLDGRNPARADQVVVVDGERIESVEPAAGFTAGEDLPIVDLAGATVFPGMVQAHWHGSYRDLDFTPPPVGLERPPGYLRRGRRGWRWSAASPRSSARRRNLKRDYHGALAGLVEQIYRDRVEEGLATMNADLKNRVEQESPPAQNNRSSNLASP